MPSAAGGPCDRPAVAQALREIGQRIALQGDADRFRARAYERAARTIERTSLDLAQLTAAGRLTDLPGIGPALAAVIAELCRTGRSQRLEQLRQEVPPAVIALAPFVGLATARRLHEGLGVTGPDDLVRACEQGRVRELRGFGPRREAQILARLQARMEAPETLPLSAALAEADRLVEHLHALPGTRADITGAARRGLETVDAVEILACAEDRSRLLEHLSGELQAPESPGDDSVIQVRTASGAPVRLWLCSASEYGTALVMRTGSDAHVRRLQALAAARGWTGGLESRPRDAEPAVYRALGLPGIPAELREDEGEIEAAQEGRLPEDLVRTEDVLGAVHCHTVASDGRDTLLAMARAAEARGFRYLTVTDHSPSAFYAHGLDLDRLRAQWDEIARVQEQVGIRLLRGSECDIKEDGSLDWPDAVLAQLDVVIVSIHQRYKMDSAAMTARLVRALGHPAFKIWGHPLGRRIGSRPPFECDLETVLDALLASRGAIEINGDPRRLDLEPRLIPVARERGLPFVISTDAHATVELGNVRYGVLMARRGGLGRGRVLNTRPAEEFARAVKPLA